MYKIIMLIFSTVMLGIIIFCGCCDENQCECKSDEYFCDPNTPVILNGMTIPEGRINRGPFGCVTRIYMDNMGISDPDCFSGIEQYSSMLEVLWVSSNELDSIDLTPLSSCARLESFTLFDNNLTAIDLSVLAGCANLRALAIQNNQLTSIDLAPLLELNWLEELNVDGNPLDSATCAQVCLYIEEHPNCYVNTDCDCGGK